MNKCKPRSNEYKPNTSLGSVTRPEIVGTGIYYVLARV